MITQGAIVLPVVIAYVAGHVGCIETGVTLRKDHRLLLLSYWFGLLVFPNTAQNQRMVLKVFSYAWKMLHNLYPEAL